MITNKFTSLNFFKNTFFKDSIIYGLSGALSRFSVFLTLPIYTRFLSVEEFGILDLYVTIGMIIFLLFEIQMKSGFMRSYYEKKSENCLNNLIGSVLKYYFYIFLFSILILLVFNFIEIELEWWNYNYILPLVLLVLPKQIFDLNNIILRMEHKSKKFLFFNVSKIFTIAILGILAVYLESTVEMILWSMFFANLIYGIVAFYAIKKFVSINLSFLYFKEMFLYAAPLVPAILINRAMSTIGRFYIITYLSAEALGLYSIALKIGMIVMIFVEAFKLAWDPFVIKRYGSINAREIFAKALNYYVIVGLVIIISIYILSPLLINILATDQYVNSLELVPVLLMAYFWQGAINITSVGNAWVRKSYNNAIASIIGGISVVIIIHFLIEEIGIQAAALGQLGGFMISFFVTLYLSQKNIKIQFSYTIILLMLISSFIVIYCIIN